MWVPDDAECYVLGTITDQQDNGTLTVTTSDGRAVTGKKFNARDTLDEKEADLVQMAYVDTPNILHTLRKRHAEGAVYTAVGQMGILISINPCASSDPRPAHRRAHPCRGGAVPIVSCRRGRARTV